MRPIRNDDDYREAMARLRELMAADPPRDSAEGNELEVLGVLVSEYERALICWNVTEPSGQVTPLGDQLKGLLEVLAASHREIERLQTNSYRAAIELLRGEADASEDDRIFLDAIDVLTDAANRRASVTAPASREGSVSVAVELGAQLRVPPGFRVVVVATDRTGSYVGVWRNTSERDTEAILNAALHGAERVDHG